MGSVLSPICRCLTQVAPIRCRLGADVVAASREHGLEGVVAKRPESATTRASGSPSARRDRKIKMLMREFRARRPDVARAEPYAGLPTKLRLLFNYRDAGLSGWLADAG
jgi:hypothetical protein